MAALTRGREGREMAEIGFLLDAGAVAFTDCDSVVENTKVFQRCLTLMHKFKIYELRDFQSGHLEPFKSYMFSSE